jgi:hypothetical protein
MAKKGLIARLKGALIKYLNAVFELRDLQRELVTFLEHESWSAAIQKAPYDDPKRLTRHGYKVFSESDEDGIIAEIFRRIGMENRVFFEFGVGDGLANNTLSLLLGGWRGYWIDGSAEFVAKLSVTFREQLQSGQLQVLNQFITRDTINPLIQKLGMPATIDLMSIDIDGNDYWIWQAIEAVSARVIVIEYNGTLRPTHSIVPEYNDSNQWNGTSYMGASLTALEKLGRQKGYSLVGCNYTGANAFFVRDDLVKDLFYSPFTAATHYEPARYLKLKSGHPPGVGPYVQI